jgi:hypothetical protein
MQFELPRDRHEELKALMARCKIDNQQDLLNVALTFLAWAVEEKSKGRIIASVDETGMKYKELCMPALEAAKVSSTAQGST